MKEKDEITGHLMELLLEVKSLMTDVNLEFNIMFSAILNIEKKYLQRRMELNGSILISNKMN